MGHILINIHQNFMVGKSGHTSFCFSDPRVKGWFLMDSLGLVLYLDIFYLLFVWLGPKFMRFRKPFQLKWVLVTYNLIVAALNAYMGYNLLTASTKLGYSYTCESCRITDDPDEMKVVKMMWLYSIAKMIEFLDTIFFVLRKKNNQITFLHVYHHSTMFLIMWVAAKWTPSGAIFVPAQTNCLVHVCMYVYYGLAALGPIAAKYLWWKKYITVIQLFQFAFVMSCAAIGIRNKECNIPIFGRYFLIAYMFSYILLFGNFYVKEYLDKRSGKAKFNRTSDAHQNGYESTKNQ